MPRGDGTGPWGQGPMTGRGLGYCAGHPQPGFANSGPGFRRGGRGFGRGFRQRRFSRYPMRSTYPVEYPLEPVRLTKTEQKKILEEEKKELELDIKAIQNEIEAIQKKIKELK
jgi:hypothetical protein